MIFIAGILILFIILAAAAITVAIDYWRWMNKKKP